ncbi:metallophosphoesterase [Sorangium cellulosum]|uniref:Metallophosphoesterase n=1 Tax=Sorangium cellulosum TaxID=56 RepID=A0A2L0EQV4_SORCE|nr:polynucleotide kinase-phosphatase [Sorangium cellulosum]AUX41683.1 metallophosphoesterase [Sorangium cellulosum]
MSEAREQKPLVVPALSLVVLVGASGSGKSTFARAHFKPSEILSSDHYRGVVADDEGDQSATADAFDVLRYIAGKRLAAGRLAVVDATNVQPDARRPFVELARQHHVLPVAIVLDLPEKLCHARNAARPDRQFGPHVVRNQTRDMRRSLRELRREGFRYVHVLSSPEEVAAATIERQRLWTDRRDDHGPFDIIGDVHGCFDELVELLEALGYRLSGLPDAPRVSPPEGRRAIFLGDLVDRGPRSPDVLRLAMAMVEAGAAICVPGNHEVKLLKKLRGRDVRVSHGLELTLAQLEAETDVFKAKVAEFIDGLVSHYVLDDGKLAVAHAGVKEAYQGRGSSAVRDFCLYGETTGETDEYGLPVRFNWASEYRGQAMVVYGHTPTTVAEWENRTICIDTGCVFGGALTALRYPERELVEVKARRVYYEPQRPLEPARGVSGTSGTKTEARAHDELDIDDVRGRRAIRTRVHGMVTIREENAAAALEAMSRFAVDPRWLIYLPPTMSPSETAKDGGLLEHPREAFVYFRQNGVGRVVCEEKHMGSRAVLVVCRDEAARRRRFRVVEGPLGACVTRTGRPFFADEARTRELVDRVRAAMDRADLWAELGTDWVCLDAEILPWSAKAQDLLRGQYAAVGASGRASLGAAVRALEQAAARDESARPLLQRHVARRAAMEGYVAAYRRYCWPVRSLADIRLAPFHLLASEGAVHAARDHGFHLRLLGRLCEADPALMAPTPHRVVDLSDPASEAQAVAFWTELVERGGEGMVVKSWEWVVRGPRGLVQPAIKCRGPEYLRIIYGPEYLMPEHLARLRSRGVGAKRALALREYALGLEALHRFVEGEPLYRVHECVFGVLALESEPVDPRL